jgi:hypothetical protein
VSAICDRCGAFDPSGTEFRRERIPFRGTRTYCPKCHTGLEERFLIGIYFIIIAFALYGFFCLWFNSSSEPGHVFVNLFMFQVIAVPSTIVHEFAHATVGKMLGLNVLRIWIGRGKTLWRCGVFGFDTEFKIIPAGGFTFLTHGFRERLRLRYFLTVFAGPVSNVIILLLASRFVVWKEFDLESSIQIGPIVFLCQAYILVENLLPYRIQSSMGTFCTDGLSLFQLLFSKSPEMFRSRSRWDL